MRGNSKNDNFSIEKRKTSSQILDHDQCKNSQVKSQTSVSHLITLDRNIVRTFDMFD